jgi:hypothetical protein
VCGWKILALLYFLRLPVALEKCKCAKMWVGKAWGFSVGMFHVSTVVLGGGLVTYNDLHASDGRDTEALNCKPITNL